MALGKKMMKYTRVNYDNSIQRMDSHGATIDKEDKLKSQGKRFPLRFSKTEKTPCSTQKETSGLVIKERKPDTADDEVAEQPSRIRRILRWLVRKTTKGENKDLIPANFIEPTTATTDEKLKHPRLNQHIYDAVQKNKYGTKLHVCGTTSEHVQGRIMSLRELCKLAVPYRIDRNVHKYNGIDEEKTAEPAQVDCACDVTSETNECDNCDKPLEFDNEKIKSLKELCKLALPYRIDRKLHKFNDI